MPLCDLSNTMLHGIICQLENHPETAEVEFGADPDAGTPAFTATVDDIRAEHVKRGLGGTSFRSAIERKAKGEG